MPFQPVPETAEARVTYRHTLSSRDYINLIYFRKVGGWTQATLQTLANELVVRFTTSLLVQNMPNGASLTALRTRDLSTEFGAVANGAGVPVLGGDFNTFSNPQSAIMVRYYPDAGPPRRGGIFWPFVREDGVSEVGLLDATYRNTVESRVQSWIEGTEIVTVSTHVIVSRYQRATPPATGSVLRSPSAVTAQVTSYQALARVASQRDRRVDVSGF